MRLSGLLIILLAVLAGCAGTASNRFYGSDSGGANVKDLSLSANAMADSVASELNDTALIAQMLMPAINASDDAENMALLHRYAEMGVGGILLLQGDSKSVSNMVDSLRVWSRIPMFVAIDAEWGLGMRLTDCSTFPKNGDLSKSVSEEAMFDYGERVGEQCRELGINMVMGPVLDVASSDSFIGNRSFGPDANRVAKLGLAYASGLKSNGVISVAKHFPGHGAAKGDSHDASVRIDKSLQALDSVDLVPFREFINNGFSAVMVGHIIFPAIDPNARPAAVSQPVIIDLLRGDLEFDGMVITDALNMGGVSGFGVVEAIQAGADIVLAPVDTRRALREVATAVGQGKLKRAELQARARRILFHKYLHLN